MDKLLKLRLVKTSNFPQRRVEKFYNQPIYLVRSGKELQQNELCFRCAQSVTKPEIKQVLQKLYGLDVKSVHTWNRMGKILRNNVTRNFYRKPDHKKIFVELQTPVPAHLQNYYY